MWWLVGSLNGFQVVSCLSCSVIKVVMGKVVGQRLLYIEVLTGILIKGICWFSILGHLIT